MALAITPSLPTARYRRLLSTLLLALAVLAVLTTYARVTGRPGLLPGTFLSRTAGRTSPAEAPMAVYHAEGARPPLEGMPQLLATLDRDLVPAPGNGRRLVIVGDVHGMIDPLNALLDKINYRRPAAAARRRAADAVHDLTHDEQPQQRSGHDVDQIVSEEGADHLVFVGDMINKGPASAAVVDLAMRLGASAVRGNHEDRVLLERAAAAIVRAGDDDIPGDAGPDAHDALDEGGSGQPSQHVLSSPAQRGDPADRACARSLSDAQAEWLAQRPAMLDLGFVPGCFPGAGRVVVAHAGLVPGVGPLEAQDPWAVMNMRSLAYPREELRRQEARETLLEAAVVRFRESDEYRSHQDHWTDQRIRKKLRPDIPAADVEDEFRRTTVPEDRDVAVPSDGRGGVPWTDAWEAAQLAVPEASRRTAVVYGHDSKLGLVERPFSIGLDSGCVRGRELSALVIEATADGVTRRIVRVPCTKPEPAAIHVYGEGKGDEDRP